MNWGEKIGFVLIVIGFAFTLLNDTWKNNPIPELMDKNMLINSAGLLIWAMGYMKRQSNEKK